MNILMVHNYYKQRGGEDTVVSNEKNMLEKHNHKVMLYTRHNSEMDEMKMISKIMIPFSSVFSLKTYRDIKHIIQKNNIDIVHVHNTLNLISPSVYYAARACKIPVIQTMHNFRIVCPGAVLCCNGQVCEKCLKGSLLPGIMNKCYRNSFVQTLASSIILIVHRITGIYGKINYIALTDFNKNILLNLKQIKKERVFVKPNYTKDAYITNTDNKKEGYVFAGRLEKIKGVHVLLKAWELLGESAPKLTICGSGELDEECRRFIASKHIPNVSFAGLVAHDELNEIISRSKTLIFPSIWYEGIPMTILEAFALATPVIAGDIGNGGFLVEDKLNGFKYEYNNPKALAETVLRMEEMPDTEYERMCGRVRKEYEDKYAEDQNYRMLMKIYEVVMNS